jgi:nicotinate-nucleotide--dimethylbenzimidazole phosphoribosyltransferase
MLLRQDTLTKPPGSLGRLEELAIDLAGIQGRSRPSVERKAVLVFAADHGVVKRGVSAYPQEVTAQMVRNFVSGGAAVSVLSNISGALLSVIDVGIASCTTADDSCAYGREIRREVVRCGSRDMLDERAMTRDEALTAMATGATVVEELACDGVDVVALGEMGIGNTTAASALTAVLCGRSVSDVTGPGTGVTGAQLAAKVRVIESAIELHGMDCKDTVDVLASFGGYEIAAIAGAIFACAWHRIPAVLDGFIVGAAALVSFSLDARVREYMIAGHCSTEPGHMAQLDFMRLKPLLSLDMRLGEGTGATLALHILDAACSTANLMSTFASAGVSKKER